MKIDGWRCYKNAAIPTIPVCAEPDLTPIKNGDIWKIDGSPMFARWTTDFDCQEETNWWYVIKDTSFDISQLKAKHRYIINKGVNAFECKRINLAEYVEQIHEVFFASFGSWPEKYRPNTSFEDTKKYIETTGKNSSAICYGAFFRETGKLCGFLRVVLCDSYVDFQNLIVDPAYEKHQINAALVHCLVTNFSSELDNGELFISDGARNIIHQTAFQDYLEKYFRFRKAYCKLHILYKPQIKWAVKILFIFRKIFDKFDHIGIVHKINAVLKMEEIIRKDRGK